MSTPKPVPALPAEHPLADRLAQWTALRDQLNELVSQLEYIKLMMRLEGKKQL